MSTVQHLLPFQHLLLFPTAVQLLSQYEGRGNAEVGKEARVVFSSRSLDMALEQKWYQKLPILQIECKGRVGHKVIGEIERIQFLRAYDDRYRSFLKI